MNHEKKLSVIAFALTTIILLQFVIAVPPHRIVTTSVTPPPVSATKEKILEINFTINQSNQVTLASLAIKNLPQAIVDTSTSDYYLEITDSNNKVLFHSNILVIFDPNTNLSQQYYAIPYPNGAKYLYFYYQNQQIAKYDVPQEFPWLYVAIGIVIAVVAIALYFVSKKYSIIQV